MDKIKKIAFLFLLLNGALSVSAQDGVEADIEAGVVTKNVWRGLDQGDFYVFPRGEVRYKGAFLNLFACTGFKDEDVKKINIGLGYRAPFGLNVGITDYWTSGIDQYDRYFNYNAKETGHEIEANIGYSCKYASLQAYTIFGGNDFKIDGNRAYSTYIQLTVPFRLVGIDWRCRAAATPFESSGWKTALEGDYSDYDLWEYRYAKQFRFVEASIRATKVFDAGYVDVPVFIEFLANPYTQKAYFVGGVSVRFSSAKDLVQKEKKEERQSISDEYYEELRSRRAYQQRPYVDEEVATPSAKTSKEDAMIERQSAEKKDEAIKRAAEEKRQKELEEFLGQ